MFSVDSVSFAFLRACFQRSELRRQIRNSKEKRRRLLGIDFSQCDEQEL
jgi:hypothetical protein